MIMVCLHPKDSAMLIALIQHKNVVSNHKINKKEKIEIAILRGGRKLHKNLLYLFLSLSGPSSSMQDNFFN